MRCKHLCHDLTLIEVLMIAVMNMLLFQPILEILIPVFSYFDEIISVASIAICAWTLARNRGKFTARMRWMMLTLVVIVAIGIVGNAALGYQDSLFFALVDVLACIKFIFVYLSLRALMQNVQHFAVIMAAECKFLLLGMFACMLVNQLFDIGMTYEVRYGLRAFQFIFIHPTHMVTLSLACFAFIYAEKKQGWLVYCLISVILMAASLRSRWIALAFVTLLLLLFIRDDTNKVPVSVSASSIFAAIALGASQFQVYYGASSESARGQLTKAAMDIMCRFFPFGTGFGTFGSGVTKRTYSQLYHEYHLDTVYGLAPHNPCYLTDTFWPVIIAQFGFIGLLLWLVMFALFISDFYRFGKDHGLILLPLVFISMLLISTTSSGSIFSVQLIALIFAYIVSISSKDIEGSE